jgi:CubicO group peptidase (beta-lactamase class C family)
MAGRRALGIRRAWVTAIAAAAVLTSVSLRADPDAFVLDRFGEYLESLRVQVGIPGLAAAVVGTNDIVWERGFGRQDVESAIFARPDTLFHVDSVTQIFTAAMTLRCVESGRLSLDDLAGTFRPGSPDAGATLGQLLTHTSDTPSGLVFSYRPERLEPLWPAIRACETGSFRKTLSNLLRQMAMMDSVPGPDVVTLAPPAEGIPSAEDAARYKAALSRLAVPYSVDGQGRASPSRYTATTLTPGTGLISTVRDIARFDLALRSGIIVRLDTLTNAWQAPMGAKGQRLPHGLGWFVQNSNGQPVVWQFGGGDTGSSSLVVTLPARGMTVILLANSNGLAKTSPALSAGDLTVSPFGRLILGVFAH